MNRLILNDWHLGVQRAAGTTPASAAALRSYLLEKFDEILMAHLHCDVIINGDLFDDFNVPLQDVLQAYIIIRCWLDNSDKNASMVLVAGNHDLSKDSSKLSSLEFLAKILDSEAVMLVKEGSMLCDGICIVPHLANQDLLNLAIERIPSEAKVVLFHANYDNGFTTASDHSLNVSHRQADTLFANGVQRIIFGHEHQKREAFQGKLICTGNQMPSSVSDCLGNPKGIKYAHILDEKFNLAPVQTWSAKNDFLEVDWTNLGNHIDKRFFRVTGKASMQQAPEVISAISKFRQTSKAFVISNAVEMEGVKEMGEILDSVERTKQFDVLNYLLEQLTPEQGKVVKNLMNKKEPA